MSVIAIVLAGCLTGAILFIAYRVYRRYVIPTAIKRLPLLQPVPRKMTQDEHDAVKQYVQLNKKVHSSSPLAFPPAQISGDLGLTPQSENVYGVTHAITRYGLATDAPYKWRYYLDSTEVHLPPLWEQYITQDNYVELIKTTTIPLVIALNGHSLVDYIYAAPPAAIPPLVVPNSSMHEQETEQVELLNIRKETPQEYALNRSSGMREAVMLSAALLLLFISLLAPVLAVPWLAAIAIVLILCSGWLLLRRPAEKNRQDVHCLRGTPKRLGLFGETDQNRINTISLGIIDLTYPTHWLAFIGHDMGKKTDVDIYVNRQVVRQGKYLSLHDEMVRFPVQRFGKNAVLFTSSLLILGLLLAYVPLSLPLTLSMAWLKGAQNIQAMDVNTLEHAQLRVGDMLRVQGLGMCYVDPSLTPGAKDPFVPFDCSKMYWNDAQPLPLPESDAVDKAIMLLNTLNTQLHPELASDPKINPGLADAIQKSGMILLDDFADIVLQTHDLCRDDNDCTRLKTALVNLANAKDWSVLVRRARNGSLKGVNVLLRPVSAETLESLVTGATSSFFTSEIQLATNALNSPSPGGFLIQSDEGKLLVDHPLPAGSLYNYTGLAQWRELQRLSSVLLHTPFNAKGIITNISIDANGTRHISLHSEPDAITIWRYLGTTLLLLVLFASALANAALLLVRLAKSRHRGRDIQRYYENCFTPDLADATGKKLP
ncbi:IgaA/UmoB family intracellular growth attenuator [Acerihabitans sp. TG2]|uniref:IgaA/UmoB family intracellular growth attenuator n=1 Tax=Acerihabitans sp. TG2 TaxID=3096008 RepID=UPI002B22E1D3|nr:IgaA/UmoB family intracellular growth attenuator [Acerihabitans sp. TG2]MEA9390902.1 IgaA/UmoB family intracellular growth attenuator [Acerihabitans sp. TG2]